MVSDALRAEDPGAPRFDGAAAVVTGGASGIGAATAALLAERGAHVVIADRAVDAGRAVAADLGGLFVEADVASAADWDRVVATTTDAFGPIRFLHLNAGINSGPQGAPITDLSPERAQATIDVNLTGVVLGVLSTVKSLGAGPAAIVVTASLGALGPFPSDPVYAASKHGQIGFVRSVAPDLARRDIRINVLCPTATDTPMINAADRAWLSSVGVTPVPVAWLAQAALECFTTDLTGQVFVCVDAEGARHRPMRDRPIP